MYSSLQELTSIEKGGKNEDGTAAPLSHSTSSREWSGSAMVLGKLPVPGRPTIWMIVGQGPIALAVGAGGGCLDISILFCPFSPLSGRRPDID